MTAPKGEPSTEPPQVRFEPSPEAPGGGAGCGDPVESNQSSAPMTPGEPSAEPPLVRLEPSIAAPSGDVGSGDPADSNQSSAQLTLGESSGGGVASRLRRVLTRRRVWRLAMISVLCVLVSIVGGRAVIVQSAKGRVFRTVEAIPHRQVALVLGSKVMADGQPSLSLRFRVEAAVDLYDAGRVDHLLMSGDNSRVSYDEPTVMRRVAMELGVPARDITLDYAGLDTWDSCARAKLIFGVTDPVVVTQSFHLDRAIFLCRQAGLDAIGYPTPDNRLGPSIVQKLRMREWVAAPKAVWEGWTGDDPKYAGKIEGLPGSENPANPDPLAP